MRRTAFITGVTGFVGSHLAESLLADGYRVVGLARSRDWVRGSEHLIEQIPLHVVELEDADEIAEAVYEETPDEIYHLAGMASVPASFRDPDLAWRVNFLGSQNVFSAVESKAPQARLLFVSTGAVYGKPSNDEPPITELSPLNPASPYAQSKLAADLLGLQFARERGLSITVVRSFNHIGPRQQGEFAIAEFASQIARLEQQPGGQLHCGRLSVERDFLDVRDVVECYRALIERGAPGEVYNMASGKSRKLQDMLDYLLGRAHRKIEIVQDETRMRSNDPQSISVNPTKLKTATGWEPKYEIEKTLDDALEYYRTTI